MPVDDEDEFVLLMLQGEAEFDELLQQVIACVLRGLKKHGGF